MKLNSSRRSLVMKTLANRPRDISDIEGLVAANTKLDWIHVRQTLAAFGEMLDQPDLAHALHRFQE